MIIWHLRYARAITYSALLCAFVGVIILEPPAERDMLNYFKVTPPVVHQMGLTLEKNGFIFRVPGAARSITLRLKKAPLPDLE